MNERAAFIEAIERNPSDDSARLVYADWLDERGEIELAKALRSERRVAFKPVCEITLAGLLADSDWGQVFADESYGNVKKETDPCPPGSDVDTTPPSRADVVEVIAAANGENDGPSWEGVFRLKDGRFLLATGWCDYTGWD